MYGFTTADSHGLIRVVGIAVAILTIIALGLHDDVNGVTAREKLAVQTVVAMATWALGFRVDSIGLPLTETVLLTDAWSLAMTVLWLVGVTNAVNFIDGLDGLAAGVSLIAVCTLLTFGFADGDVLLTVSCTALAGALIGFLFFNFNPATIFMGDCGSLFLGFTLALVGMESTNKQATAWALVLPVLALGLPIFDMIFAVVRRLLRGQSVMTRDEDHVHHQLLRAGYSHRQAVLVLYAMCLLMAAVAWVLKATQNFHQAMLLAFTGGIVFVVMHVGGISGRMRRLQKSSPVVLRPLGPQHRAFQRCVRLIASCDDLPLIFEYAAEGMRAIGGRRVELTLFDGQGRHFVCGNDEMDSAATVAAPINGTKHRYGDLLVTFDITPPDSGQQLCVQWMADSISQTVAQQLNPKQHQRFAFPRIVRR